MPLRPETGGGRRARYRTAAALAGVLALALGLRLWGLSASLPCVYHPDEPVNARVMRTMVLERDPLPHFYDYPSLSYYINAAAYVPYRLMTGKGGTPPALMANPIMGVTKDGDPGAMLLGRSISVLFGVATVAVVFLLARGAGMTRVAALGAAAVVAVLPDHVESSRFVTPDVIAVFFAVLSVYGAVRVVRDGGYEWYALAGVSAGLAAGTKYNAGLVVVALVAAHLLRAGLSPRRAAPALVGIGLCGAAFVASTPAVVFDSLSVLRAVRGVGSHYSAGHPGMQGHQLSWYAGHLLTTLGPVAALAFVAPWRALRERSSALLVLLAFPAAYLAFICSFAVRNARTLLPAEPFLAILGVVAAVGAVEALSRDGGSLVRSRATVLPVVAIVCLVLPLAVTIRQSAAYAGVSAQERAREWMAANVAKDAVVYFESYSPYISDTHPDARAIKFLNREPAEEYRRQGADYLVFSRNAWARFFEPGQESAVGAEAYERLWSELRLVRKFEDDAGQEIGVYALAR